MVNSDPDRTHISRAIELSEASLAEGGTPFGAVVVLDGQVLGEGYSSVVLLCDPTAHAEVMAIRAAATAAGTHLLDGAVLFSSSEPCPLCLAACYWAHIDRVVIAATTHDVAVAGFEDLRIYGQFLLDPGQRRVRVVRSPGERERAVGVLAAWMDSVEGGVEPKL